MQYILNEEEYQKYLRLKDVSAFYRHDALIQDLRKKIMSIIPSKLPGEKPFKCYHDLTEEEAKEIYIDDGYCDGCPLSFTQNEEYETNFEFCPHEDTLYGK